MRGSITHNHRHEHVLRLEGELDPRSPRFEDAGLRSNGGGKVQLIKGGARETDSRRCGKVRDRVRGRVQNIGAQGHASKQKFAVLSMSRTMATRMIGGFDKRDTCVETEAIRMSTVCAMHALCGQLRVVTTAVAYRELARYPMVTSLPTHRA